MTLPFSIEQFFEIFKHYNETVWPAQIVLNALAVAAIVLIFTRLQSRNKLSSGILGALWLWMGIVYHLLFFSSINKAAYLFGILFILQGFIFLVGGTLKAQLSFQYKSDVYHHVGSLLMLYGLVIYPILGYFLGHVYPEQPTFGLPCPTTIFTFGLLLWTTKRVPKYVLIIPFLWSLVGTMAAVKLGVREDIGLFVAGITTVILLIVRDRQKKSK